jgi:hypothetical protein
MSDAQATAESHWYDLPYWQANFPQVRLNPSDNTHVAARTLRVEWTSQGAPPIVAVEFLPRSMPAPERPEGYGDILTGITAIVGIVIPGLSAGTQALTRAALTAVSVGAGVEHLFALQDWARSFKATPDEFGPQYSPRAFTVPMPLDRAQIMVSRPWYGPAMVYQFAQEIQTGRLLTTAAAYADLLKAMLPAGWADPAPATQGQAPLFRFVDPWAVGRDAVPSVPDQSVPALTSQERSGTLGTASLPATTANAAALPLLVAAGLLVAGAPIVLVVIVGAAMLGAGKAK